MQNKFFKDINAIPEEIMVALEHSWYKGYGGNNFSSVTRLMQPPKMFWIGKQLEKDTSPKPASKYLYALEGHINHGFFETVFGEIDGYVTEQSMSVPYKVDGREFIISGTTDLINKTAGILTDWKNMSVAKFNRGDFIDYERQLNIYAYIVNVLHLKGTLDYMIKKLKIVAKLRDWSQMGTIQSSSYPKVMYQTIPVRLWPSREARSYIDQRIRTLIHYENYELDDIPECTAVDRWQQEATFPVFKVQKNGEVAKTARACSGTAKFTCREQGLEWIQKKIDDPKCKDKHTIVERKSNPLRCKEYCQASQSGACSWWEQNKHLYV